MASNSTTIRKLQTAINSKGGQVLYNSSQFYSVQQHRPVTVYHVKQAVYNEYTGKNANVELFKSTSQIQILLFLRDMWYELNGWELPTDNEMWNELRAKNKGDE